MDSILADPKRALMLVLVSAAVGFLAIILARGSGALQRAEMFHHDKVAVLAAIAEKSSDVVLVTVEEQDLAAWGWPLPDSRIANILRAIDRADPAVIGLDIYRDTPVGDGDELLRRALTETATVGITKLGAQGGLTVKAHEALQASGLHGFADVPVDSDGVVRRALLLVSDADGLHMSFALRLAMSKLGQSNILPWPEDPRVMMLGGFPLPAITPEFASYHRIDAAGYQVPLSFHNRLPVARSIPARDILANDHTDAMRGKVVIVGLHSDSIKDYFRTPLNSGNGPRFTYGSQVQAATVQMLLDIADGTRRLMRDVPMAAEHALILLAALAGAFSGRAAQFGFWLVLFVPTAALAVFGGLSAALARGLWLPAVPMLLAFTLAFLVCFGTLAVLGRRQRRIMAQLFSDHLSPDLAAQIWQNRTLFMTGGKPCPQQLEATVIFLDIEGSTAIGGVSDPETFFGWISRVLDALSDTARAHGGFIEKFTGDGLLIAFGAPLKRETVAEMRADAEAACRCAWALGLRVAELNAEANSQPRYRVRIGLHSGTVFGGVLGNRGTLQYNLVGDTMNVAARIEAYGKHLKDRQESDAMVCLSGQTLERSGDVVTADPIGTLLHDDGKTLVEVFRMRAVR